MSKEIEALEEALCDVEPDGHAWGSKAIIEASQNHLKLLKGKHETLVIVPRKPTVKQRVAGVKSDDKRTGMETCTHIYKAMIQASQEGE